MAQKRQIPSVSVHLWDLHRPNGAGVSPETEIDMVSPCMEGSLLPILDESGQVQLLEFRPGPNGALSLGHERVIDSLFGARAPAIIAHAPAHRNGKTVIAVLGPRSHEPQGHRSHSAWISWNNDPVRDPHPRRPLHLKNTAVIGGPLLLRYPEPVLVRAFILPKYLEHTHVHVGQTMHHGDDVSNFYKARNQWRNDHPNGVVIERRRLLADKRGRDAHRPFEFGDYSASDPVEAWYVDCQADPPFEGILHSGTIL